MTGKILIIASYNGYRHKTMPAARMLRIQHQQLSKLRHSLDKVLVVVNEDYPLPQQPDEDYEAALSLFPSLMRRPNDSSYAAWRDGFFANPEYDWYFFLEDDYTFFLDNFDQRMIDMWTPSTTYLATKKEEEGPYGKHASMSNGLVSGDILRQANWLQLCNDGGEYNSLVQVSWSRCFGNHGLRDISQKYR